MGIWPRDFMVVKLNNNLSKVMPTRLMEVTDHMHIKLVDLPSEEEDLIFIMIVKIIIIPSLTNKALLQINQLVFCLLY